MKYLYGLDLSMKNTGVTIFDLETKKPVYIGSIETKDKHSHGERLSYISQYILKLKEKYPPSIIAIERGFSRFNTSTQVIYRVHGVVNYLFHDIEQVYYPPKKIKEAIIKGDASKKLVRQVIERNYPDVKFKNEDQSDSFAIGLTYMIINGLIEWDKKLNKKRLS
ncbi:crossover junction endodeoxyribonuclease RuvC [Streptomyces sp. NPDC057927]